MIEKRKLRTNKELLAALQELGSSGTDQHFCIALDNGVFHIHITGGEMGESEPEKMLPSLADYEKLSVELWDHKEMPEGDFSMEPLVIKENQYGTHPGYTFTFNVHVFPHKPIMVPHDERFRNQRWAKQFMRGTALGPTLTGSSKAMVSPDVLCTILRYCEKISTMKAFW